MIHTVWSYLYKRENRSHIFIWAYFSRKSLEKVCKDTHLMLSGHSWEDVGTGRVAPGISPSLQGCKF